ncbi:HEAT repeat domain-containing protein [candidate division KSB1 bacterium]|nr:HEAT repeat domain-containing protein [candidate division KSB1 bacterium]
MNHQKKTLVFGLIIFLTFSVILIFSQNATADVKAKTDELLGQIQTYEFGQSREPLTALADLVRSSIDFREDKKLIEKGMLAFLKTDATFSGKQFICKQLSIIGTEEAVPTLAPMLLKKETSDIARYALERIAGNRVDKALRKALSKSKKNMKVGIINTLGQRKDERSVKAFGKLVYDSNVTIATAAAAALGKIANAKASETLAEAKDKTKGSVKSIVLDSYLMCADLFNANENQAKALEIYRQLFAQGYSMPIRSAALRGLIIASGDKGGDIIVKILKTENEKIKTTAIGMVRELPSSQKADKIAAELANLSVTNKIQLLAALADRGDNSVHDDVVKATKNENNEVRIAATKALARLGSEADIDLLTKMAAKSDLTKKETARETLALLSGTKVDETIVAKIADAEPEIQVELIQSVGSRNISSAVDVLLKTAVSENRKVRLESIKSLELVGTPKDLDNLVDLLLNVQTNVERRRAEKTIVAVAHKIEKQDEQAAVVLKKLPSVKNVENRSSLLRVLGNIGDSNGLPVLQKALKDKNEDIQKASIQALSDWPTPEPLEDLLVVAKSSKNEVHQVLALRGHIRLLGLPSERTNDETIQLYKTAMKLAQNAGEKRMVLSGISNIRTVNALNSVANFLTDTELKNEAEVAVVRIARHTRGNFPQETKAVLLKVVDSKNSEVSTDARRFLKEIEK